MESLKELQPALWRCNKCGACTSVCPLYRQTRDELMSARGKLSVIDALLEGHLKPGKGYEECLYNCLLCQACAAGCASGVPTTEIFLAARRELAKIKKQSIFLNSVLLGVLARPELLKLGVSALRLYRDTGLHRLCKSTGLFKLLPSSLQRAQQLLFHEPHPGTGTKHAGKTGDFRGKVAYFTGCAAMGLMPQVGKATRRLLAYNGWEAVTPRNLCCGLPHRIYGDVATACTLAKKNIDLFKDFDIIVTDCATCGAALKEYKNLLAGDEVYKERANTFSAKVRDISEFLTEQGYRPFSPLENRVSVTYHDPCHLARGQGIRKQPRQLLNAIPGVKLIEMANPENCCGGGGFFQITHPRLSAKVGSEKAKDIINTGAAMVITACPVCINQLKLSLSQEAGNNIKTFHLSEILAGLASEFN
ncbi:(Fe-S)-binding protein [Desulfallas sp. Bu1-1]|uniref:(Fe-S)-binding protein n=1 Tax=Desulfallas sp. Bu1-1 TaxID=2787620 RepID=UPI001FAC716F|nr:(Fe-S)-binding protein [Desulfallas sp. Bu1-1]